MNDRRLTQMRPGLPKLRVGVAAAVAAMFAAVGGIDAVSAVRLDHSPTTVVSIGTAPPEQAMPAERRATINDPNCETPSTEADLRALDGLARAVAAESGGQARRTVVDQRCFRGKLISRSVILLVILPAGGHFAVRADVAGPSWGAAGSAGWNCAFAASDKIDKKPCTQYSISVRQSLTSSTLSDPGMSGRASLDYAALTLSDSELSVHIDNYAELPSGEKAVGPTWREAGFTPARLREIVNTSGLLS